jgi:hypothetical protein
MAAAGSRGLHPQPRASQPNEHHNGIYCIHPPALHRCVHLPQSASHMTFTAAGGAIVTSSACSGAFHAPAWQPDRRRPVRPSPLQCTRPRSPKEIRRRHRLTTGTSRSTPLKLWRPLRRPWRSCCPVASPPLAFSRPRCDFKRLNVLSIIPALRVCRRM